MSFADVVLWAFLCLVFGWVGWIIWSTFAWLRSVHAPAMRTGSPS